MNDGQKSAVTHELMQPLAAAKIKVPQQIRVPGSASTADWGQVEMMQDPTEVTAVVLATRKRVRTHGSRSSDLQQPPRC